MKKAVVASLAAAMVIGVAGISFAASNPFVDVPANHWSYASVTKLAQAGIVDGYGDSTFRGDKVMSRYEMAQITAKAMAHSDKADAAQKAEIDKLAVEFADELAGLNVRVTTLEKNQPNLKFNGNLALRYTSKDDQANADKSTAARYRLRLEGNAVVDQNTTATVRFANNSYNKTLNQFGIPGATQWSTFGSQAGGGDTAVMDRVYITHKFGDKFTVAAGRQSLVLGTTQAITDVGNTEFDGVKVSAKLGAVDAVINHGRLVAQKDVDSLELSTKANKFAFGVGYAQLKDNAGTVLPAGTVTTHHNAVAPDATHNYAAAYDTTTYSLGKDMLKLRYVNASYLFAPKFSLAGEYGQNKADYATTDNSFYNVLAKVGDQALNAAGKQNFVAQYYSVGKNALALDGAGIGLTTLDTTPTATKFTGWDLSYNRAFSKNMYSEFHYVKIDDKSTNANDYNYYRVNLVSKF